MRSTLNPAESIDAPREGSRSRERITMLLENNPYPQDVRVRSERIVFALDCGITINPDLIRAQVEGGLLFGLSAAAWGEVVLGDGGEIVTQNFDRYPLVRMRSVPAIEVHLIDSTESPTGVGEVSVPSVAPALANAIAALTGTRIRQLPLSKTIKIY